MKSIYLLLFILVSYRVQSQMFPYKKLREVKLQPGIDRISVDRLGGFYTLSKCDIEQFDPEGRPNKKYFSTGCAGIELIEAWPLMRIYAYQKSKQQFLVFDHSLEIVDSLEIDPAFAVDPQLAAPSSDLKSYWILDMDNSIKKIDINSGYVSLESEALKEVKGRFTYIREYQSMLFLLNQNSGIYVINKLGKLVSEIDTSGIQYFSFLGEDLYYLKGDQLHFYDIFSRDTYSIEVPAGNKFVVATDEKLILVKDGRAEIFEFSPRK